MDFGSNIKALRKRRDMAQHELAAEIGVSQPTIALIETGDRKPSIEVAAKLAAFFGVTIDDLYNGIVQPEPV